MHQIDLNGAILDSADLTGAEGAEANFYDTSFVNANLRGVEMNQCIFEGTNFTNANLRGAILEYSVFWKANFSNADLRDAIGFYDIDKAIFSNTIMPDGSIWYDSIGL